MKLEQTSLQIIEFGDDPSDKFHCLIDLRISPNGLNIEKMKLTNPRNIDHQFREAGCILMFTGDETEELISRGDLDSENLHQSLFDLAIREGTIKKD